MTPAEARQALLDALTVERFTTHRPERPAVTVEGPGRLFTATREAVVLDEWTVVDDYGWEIVVTRFETICRHCRKPFHGQISARGRRATLPRYCTPGHSHRAQEMRKSARERKGRRRLAQ